MLLYYIILYYIILYCIVLYYIVLYNQNIKENPEEVVQSVKLSLASVDKANHGKFPINLGYGRLHGACNQWLYNYVEFRSTSLEFFWHQWAHDSSNLHAL